MKQAIDAIVRNGVSLEALQTFFVAVLVLGAMIYLRDLVSSIIAHRKLMDDGFVVPGTVLITGTVGGATYFRVVRITRTHVISEGEGPHGIVRRSDSIPSLRNGSIVKLMPTTPRPTPAPPEEEAPEAGDAPPKPATEAAGPTAPPSPGASETARH
jgi:hypothetical protein